MRGLAVIVGAQLLGLACLVGAGCMSGSTPPGIGVIHPSESGASGPGTAGGASAPAVVPRPRHTVVVVLENHSYGEIIASPQAPFINKLAHQGALFTAAYAVTHPSEPNYLALFSGSTHGVTGDPCPTTLRAPNLATDLIAAHLSFAGYAEGLPAAGSMVCDQGNYARKHVPWADFTNVPKSVILPFSRFPVTSFSRLPTVSFVIPDLCDDMHDCPVATGDAWLRRHVARYARWAMTHDSLLIVTFDEDDGSQSNRIVTIFAGRQVVPGRYGRQIDHYNVLRTIEQAYGLRRDAQAATHYPITWIWRRAG